MMLVYIYLSFVCCTLVQAWSRLCHIVPNAPKQLWMYDFVALYMTDLNQFVCMSIASMCGWVLYTADVMLNSRRQFVYASLLQASTNMSWNIGLFFVLVGLKCYEHCKQSAYSLNFILFGGNMLLWFYM